MAILCDNSTKQKNLEEHFCETKSNSRIFKTYFEILHDTKLVISQSMRLNQLGKKIQNSGGFPATEMSPQYSLPIPSVYCLEIWIVFHKCGESTLFSRHIFNMSYNMVPSKRSFRRIPSLKCLHFLCVFACAADVISQVTAVAWGPFHDCRAGQGRSHTGEPNSNHCIVSSLHSSA